MRRRRPQGAVAFDALRVFEDVRQSGEGLGRQPGEEYNHQTRSEIMNRDNMEKDD